MKMLRTRWLSRAGKALEADDIETAKAIVERQLERKPDDLDALYLLARIHSFMEQYEAAQEIYERLLKMDDTDEEARERLRQTHLQQAFQAREAGGIEAAAELTAPRCRSTRTTLLPTTTSAARSWTAAKTANAPTKRKRHGAGRWS